ncbi:MAG: PAS domain S-box protein, partial [Gemmatimonadetes bacterium]|nr:PAS domain S-box protein [Gemmatimonadota bacterium]
IRKDGTFFPVSCAASPIFENEVPVGTVVEVRDVTEDRRAEAELRASEERYRFLAETLPAHVWTARPDGSLDFVSERTARYFGTTSERLVGEGWQNVVHPEDIPSVLERWTRSLATGEPYEVEFRLLRHDGAYRWHLGRALAMRDAGGGIAAWFGVNADIDDQKHAEVERERLIGALDAERTRLAELFREAPAFIAVLRGPEHVFTLANPPYLQLVGHREVVGKRVADALPEVVEQGFIELLDGVYGRAEPFIGSEVPILLERTPGARPEQRFVNFVYQPLRDAEGAVSGIFVHGVDVTDQVRAREEVEALAVQRSAILSQIADGVVVTEPDGRISFVNDTAREMLGTPARAAGVEEYTSTYNVFTMDGEPFPPEQLPLARAVRDGETVTGALWRVRRPDGTEMIGQGSATPVVAEDGTRLGAVLTMRDITEQRRLQLLLEAERTRLQEVFTQAPAAIAVSRGPEHLTVSANPMYRQITGGRDTVGRTAREVFPELEGQGFFELLDQVYATGEPFVGNEMRAAYDRDGDGRVEEAFFNFVYQPLRGADGGTEGIMTFAVEVTGQVRAREEVEHKAEEIARTARALEASNRELDQFAYVASHDLKAPLRGIANLSQWIEEDLGDRVTEEAGEHLRLLRGRVHRMEGLIDGILQYSRAGRVREKLERVDVGALLDEVVDLIAPPESVTIVVGEGMPELVTERLPLQQVFMNLIGNAVKYTRRPDARVEVEVRDAGDFHEFSVSDNGPGIAPEYHERIFGIFQTLEARDRVEGTGIGLSLVRKIVESRGGRVQVESAEGAGATFRFLWPRDSRGEPGQ